MVDGLELIPSGPVHTGGNMPLFKIKDPKFTTQEVLLRADKVGVYNEIVFENPDYPGVYWAGGATIRNCPKGTNGVLNVYYVPLRHLNQWVDNPE